MNYLTGGAFASVLAQIPEIPYEQLGVFGMVAAAVFTLAVVLLVGMRTITPIIALLTSTFRAMQDSNAALMKQLDATAGVIDRNSEVIATVPVALDKYAAENKTAAAVLSVEVGTIRTDVSKLGSTVNEQLDALKVHITETGTTNTEAVISEVKKAAVALEDLKTYSREQNDAVLTRVNEVEQAIIAALNRLALPQTTKTETATTTLTRKIETGKLPAATELLTPPDTKDSAA